MCVTSLPCVLLAQPAWAAWSRGTFGFDGDHSENTVQWTD